MTDKLKPLTIIGQSCSNTDTKLDCPLYLSPVKAGWPFPAEDYIEELSSYKFSGQIQKMSSKPGQPLLATQ